MNIDIRNINYQFENEIEKIKEKHSYINTNSKAIEIATKNYLELLYRVEQLKEEKHSIKQELEDLKDIVEEYFTARKELKSRIETNGSKPITAKRF